LEKADEDDDEIAPELYSLANFHADLKKIKNATKSEKEAIELLLQFPDIKSIRSEFLPAYLHEIIADEKGGWQSKLCSHKNFLTKCLKLFGEMNTFEFIQQMSPQPKFSARYTGLTTTILAGIWCSFLKKYPDTLKDEKDGRT
jgi:hypothetical protein